MSADERFFDDLKTWSEIKLRILIKYLDAYMRYRGSQHLRIYYVDGFAGTGWYGDEDDGREGSPVLVARLAQSLANSGKINRLICINVELQPSRFALLQRSLSPFDENSVKSFCGPFDQHLPEILIRTQGCPALYFLDPFGPKAIKLEDLAPLLRRPDTELLLNLNTPYLRRMAGFEDSSGKGAAAKVRLVSEVLGENPADGSPEWLRQWHKLRDGVRWEDWAAGRYLDRLVGNSPYLRYGVRYPVRESYTANPKYWLVFATRAREPIPLMNDFVCTEEDDLLAKPESPIAPGQQTFLPDFLVQIRDSERDAQLRSLVDEIHSFGRSHQDCTRTNIINHFVFGEYFGRFKLKHYRQAVDRLVHDGRAYFAGQQRKDDDPIHFL